MSDTQHRVYVPDEKCVWLPAEVISEADGKITVKALRPDDDQDEDAASKVLIEGIDLTKTPGVMGNVDALPMQNEDVPENGASDMCSLGYLHEAAVLYNLRRRYFRNTPYTYTGAMCIAINPYQWLAHLYQDKVRSEYVARPRDELPPHVYAVSAAAYKGVANIDVGSGKWSGVDQSILVSGESGAGKTETVKIMMGHLASVAAVDDELDAGDTVVSRVLRSQPLLESFGNAKTVRNDNSSRFGKFTQLEFALEAGKVALVGSRCRTYLLEKSRVVNQAENERTYHCFYGVAAARTALFDKDEFAKMTYVASSDLKTKTIEGMEDSTRFEKVCEALEIVGVGTEKQDALCAVLRATLALGEVRFVVRDVADTNSPAKMDDAAQEAAKRAAECIGLPADADGAIEDQLGAALTERSMRARGEVFKVALNVGQAYDARDAFAKALYVRVFDWLVAQINVSTTTNSADPYYSLRVVGLLDIFGFESFAINRFEQLCINYTNEKLQQKFTLDLFKTVQLEYDDERVPWKHVAFPDNAAVLTLIEGRMGVIDALNEECMRPKGTDENFVAKLKTLHGSSENAKLLPHRIRKDQFTIKHYAGDVLYTAEKWLERNNDTLQEDISLLAQKSTTALVAELFEEKQQVATKAARRGSLAADTVTTKFKSQLAMLIEEIERTSVQYVRCLKPNKLKSPRHYDAQMVVEQLRCAGVIEAVRVARAGYPNKLLHADFERRFSCLKSSTKSMKAAELAFEVLGKPITEDSSEGAYANGLTKVYFKAGTLEDLERRRARTLASFVVVVQGAYRGFAQRRRYTATKRGALLMSAEHRRASARGKYVNFLLALIRLQAHARRQKGQRTFSAMRRDHAAVVIGARARAQKQRAEYVKLRRAATKLASLARSIQAVVAYKIALADAKEQAKLGNQLEAMQRRMEQMELDNASRLAAVMEQQKAPGEQPAPVQEDDMQGEALKLLQQLRKENERLRTQNSSLSTENASLKRKVTELEAGQAIKSDWLAAARQQMALGIANPGPPVTAGRLSPTAAEATERKANRRTSTDHTTTTPLKPKASRLGSVMASLGFSSTPDGNSPAAEETQDAASSKKKQQQQKAPHIALPLNRFWQDVPATSLSAVVPRTAEEVTLVHLKVGGQYLRATGTHQCCVDSGSSKLSSAASALANNDGANAELCYLRCESPAVCVGSAVTSAHVDVSPQRKQASPSSTPTDEKVRGYRIAMAFRVERVNDNVGETGTTEGGFSLIDQKTPASGNNERFRLRSELTGGYLCVGGLFQRYCLLASATTPKDAATFEFVARSRGEEDPMAVEEEEEDPMALLDTGDTPTARRPSAGSDSMERLRARQLLVALRVVDGPKPDHFVRVRPDGYVNVAPPNATVSGQHLAPNDRATPLLSVELLVPLHSYEITFHSSQLGLIVSKTMPLRVVRFKDAGANFPAAEMTGRIGVGDVLATADGKDILASTRREAVDLITSSRPITIGFRVASTFQEQRNSPVKDLPPPRPQKEKTPPKQKVEAPLLDFGEEEKPKEEPLLDFLS